MFETLSEYGITPQNISEFDSIVKLRTLYESVVSELRGDSNVTQKALAETVKKNPAVAKRVEALIKELKSMIFTAIDEVPEIAVVLNPVITELKSDVASEADYWLSKNKQVKVEVPEDYADKRQAAADLQESIYAVWNLFSATYGDFDTEKFPVKETKARKTGKGKVLPSLSHLPSENPAENEQRGRQPKSKFMQFKWNGKMLPAGTLLIDVAHDIVSNREKNYRISIKALQDAVTSTGAEFFSNKPWKVKFETGTLEGWIPKSE